MLTARIEVFEGRHFMPVALLVELFEKAKGTTLFVRCEQAEGANPDPEAPSRMLEQLRGRLLEELPEIPGSALQMVLRQALAQLSEAVEKGRRLRPAEHWSRRSVDALLAANLDLGDDMQPEVSARWMETV